MKRAKIKNICAIRFGVNAKTNDREGVRCIQGRDINENKIDLTGNGFVAPDAIAERDYLQKGNVLFSAKGSRHIATTWNKEDQAVASSTFFILTINEQGILPAYLTWYLNQPNTQNFLQQIQKGSTISVISKKDFEVIEIDIPPIEMQKKIMTVVHLEDREQQIMEALKEKRKLLIESMTNKIFQK